MFGIFFLCCLYIGFVLLYQKVYKPEKPEDVDSWGAKEIGRFFITIAIGFFFYYLLAQNLTLNSPPANPKPGGPTAPPNPAGKYVFYAVMAIFGLLVWKLFYGLIERMLKANLTQNPAQLTVAKRFCGWAVATLVLIQLFEKNALTNNIFAFLVALVAIDLSVQLRRSALGILMIGIAIFDIWMVWLSGSAKPGVAPGQDGALIQMIRSDFFQHLPLPLGIVWGGRFLGIGDLLFIGIVVSYARRVFSIRAALISGLLAILPILALPYAHLVVHNAPLAWPYTIFIAPVGLVLALLPRPIRIPEEWKDSDGPEVIGKPPKSC